jgi:cytochrome c553
MTRFWRAGTSVLVPKGHCGGARTCLQTIAERTDLLIADRFRIRFLNSFLFPLAIMKKIFALLALAGIANLATAATDIVGNPKAAGNKIAMCIGCHGIPGYRAAFPEVYQVPLIGGQTARYLEAALHAYKRGERNNPSMRGIALGLTDQEIADLAAYYAQQK